LHALVILFTVPRCEYCLHVSLLGTHTSAAVCRILFIFVPTNATLIATNAQILGSKYDHVSDFNVLGNERYVRSGK
jgi:hypothetical protein